MRRRGRPPYPELLTPREQEVLSLIREGLTNEQIAARLGISLSGARYHVSEILGKLGVASRAEAAAWRGARRVPAFAPLLTLRRFANGWERVAAATLAVSIVALLALAIGVAVMAQRGGVSGDGAMAGAQSEEVRAFIAIADEATIEARKVMPDAGLYFIATGAGGIYTFRFFEPGTRNEMALAGPYRNDPAFPLWEVFPDQPREPGAPVPEVLDLTGLRHTPAEVEAFVLDETLRQMVVYLQSVGGALLWTTHYINRLRTQDSERTWCSAYDRDLAQLTCEGPRPFP